MTGRVSQYIDALIEHLKIALPDCQVERFGGRFGVDEVRRYATKAPAVFVATESMPASLLHTSEQDAEINVVLVILTRDTRTTADRHQTAENIAEQLMLYLPNKNFGVEYAFPCRACIAQNLYTAQLNELGVALWGVVMQPVLRFLKPSVTQAVSHSVHLDLTDNNSKE